LNLIHQDHHRWLDREVSNYFQYTQLCGGVDVTEVSIIAFSSDKAKNTNGRATGKSLDFFAVTAPPQTNPELRNMTDARIVWSHAAKDITLACAINQIL
jgi:hypothetical protein